MFCWIICQSFWFSYFRTPSWKHLWWILVEFGSSKIQAAVVQRCSLKKLFLKISQYSEENNCVEVLFHQVVFTKDSNTCAFLWILRNFLENLFWRTFVNGFFSSYRAYLFIYHMQNQIVIAKNKNELPQMML